MSQFVCITGAREQETKWFSIPCNALGGQIGHILKDAETAAIYFVKGLNRVLNPLFALFLVYFCGCLRHLDPVYEFMT
ncbi:hypothetical protein MNBD_ALPHA12-1203 [hydrothermal vent metagenome]|uniref:Uncharacterized protein n=1 Tax=hydrothermal vent metagenome TaxID=652676 RepID=A0A3B0TNF5_9ZZZZ